MAQFYFLSVLLNIIAGLVLVYGIDLTKDKNNSEDEAGVVVVKKTSSKSKKSASVSSEKEEKPVSETGAKVSSFFGNVTCFENRNFRLVLGVLCVLVGIMKLLSVFRNDVPVVGDLLPSLAGLLSGASLLLEYYLVSATTEVNISDKVKKFLIDGRKYIGVFCLVAGLLHFIFPQVLLL